MESNKEYIAALKKELKDSIYKKLADVKSRIDSEVGPEGSAYLQMLINVNDELDDVLLNWETNAIDLDIYSINRGSKDELDDDGEY